MRTIEELLNEIEINTIRKVKKNEIIEVCENVSPFSPKTGKPISFGTYMSYVCSWVIVWRNCSKDWLVYYLRILSENKNYIYITQPHYTPDFFVN